MYGTASAPYLAVRRLKKLAQNFKSTYPDASSFIETNFYVDGLICSFPSENEAISTCTEVNMILKSACFRLRKWVSNNTSVTNVFRGTNDPTSTVTFNKDKQIKALGIIWNNTSNTFPYQVSTAAPSSITKRNILSDKNVRSAWID